MESEIYRLKKLGFEWKNIKQIQDITNCSIDEAKYALIQTKGSVNKSIDFINKCNEDKKIREICQLEQVCCNDIKNIINNTKKSIGLIIKCYKYLNEDVDSTIDFLNSSTDDEICEILKDI